MITLGKAGTLHDRRLASARLHQDEVAIKVLFNEIAPTQKERRGGYTRIVRLGQRQGDAAQLAILEFVDVPLPEAAPVAAAAEAEKPAEKAETKAEEKAEGKAGTKAEEKKEAPAPA
jgi:large subunit ribosomal protein L17